MKAIRVAAFGDPEIMQLVDLPDPVPGKGEVVVRVRAAGVNPVDTYLRSGGYGAIPLPYTPGADAGGVVEKIGPEVTRVAVGDRVYTAGSLTGTYAELALCKQEQVHRLPAQILFQQGAAIGIPYGTAYRALFIRGQAKAGQTILVHGASGGVGIAAVQLGAAGMQVIGTAGSDQGAAMVLQQGAHHVLDHGKPGYLDKIAALTDGRGVDVILEMLANVNLNNDLPVLAQAGRVVVIGSRGKVEIDPRLTMSRDLNIMGMSLRSAGPQEMMQIHAALGAGLENGSLRPIIDEEIPLAEAPRAHHEVMKGGSRGKIVLVV